MATSARGEKKRTPAARRASKKSPNHDGSLERIYTRVPPEIKAAVEKIAAAEHRSTMQWLRLLLEREVTKHSKKKGK